MPSRVLVAFGIEASVSNGRVPLGVIRTWKPRARTSSANDLSMPPLSMTMSRSIAAAIADSQDREHRAEPLPSETSHPPREPGHPLPQSTIGRVRTRRAAAAAPATTPRARERATLKKTIPGVTIEKVKVVSKKRR